MELERSDLVSLTAERTGEGGRDGHRDSRVGGSRVVFEGIARELGTARSTVRRYGRALPPARGGAGPSRCERPSVRSRPCGRRIPHRVKADKGHSAIIRIERPAPYAKSIRVLSRTSS